MEATPTRVAGVVVIGGGINEETSGADRLERSTSSVADCVMFIGAASTANEESLMMRSIGVSKKHIGYRRLRKAVPVITSLSPSAVSQPSLSYLLAETHPRIVEVSLNIVLAWEKRLIS
jgi:hypothetical protein